MSFQKISYYLNQIQLFQLLPDVFLGELLVIMIFQKLNISTYRSSTRSKTNWSIPRLSVRFLKDVSTLRIHELLWVLGLGGDPVAFNLMASCVRLHAGGCSQEKFSWMCLLSQETTPVTTLAGTFPSDLLKNPLTGWNRTWFPRSLLSTESGLFLGGGVFVVRCSQVKPDLALPWPGLASASADLSKLSRAKESMSGSRISWCLKYSMA